jgi:hypothetical protein
VAVQEETRPADGRQKVFEGQCRTLVAFRWLSVLLFFVLPVRRPGSNARWGERAAVHQLQRAWCGWRYSRHLGHGAWRKRTSLATGAGQDHQRRLGRRRAIRWPR